MDFGEKLKQFLEQVFDDYQIKIVQEKKTVSVNSKTIIIKFDNATIEPITIGGEVMKETFSITLVFIVPRDPLTAETATSCYNEISNDIKKLFTETMKKKNIEEYFIVIPDNVRDLSARLFGVCSAEVRMEAYRFISS